MKRIGILHILFVALLIWLDEFIKYYIVYIKKAPIDVCNSEGEWIHFHPTYNTAGSALSLKTSLDFSQVLFMLLAFVVSLAMIYYWVKYRKLLDNDQKGTVFLLGFDIMLAGSVGRIVERIFWPYTLDYIAIRDMAICDLIDIYLFLGGIGILLVIFYINVKNKRKCKPR